MLKCAKCKNDLTENTLNTPGLTKCPICRATMQAEVFPALYRESDAPKLETIPVLDDEAGCFYHPQRKAQSVCQSCGRFLCDLCQIDLHGQDICPACVETARKKQNLGELVSERLLYDRIAFFTAILPMIFLWPTIVSAPITIYIVVRYWKKPQGLLGRSRFRFIFAFILAALQITGWTWFAISKWA